MSTQVQYRRGTSAQNDAFTGALGEITVDTTNWTLRVADGVTAGGFTLASLTATQTLTNKTLNAPVIINGMLNGNANGVGNIGNTSTYFNTAFVKATSAQYADVAERYRSDADYPVGTVLVFGGTEEVTQSQTTHDTSIAGTVSENPAYIMNAGLESPCVATVALLGRVPCRVMGNIGKGDLLVSSETSGVATKLDQTQYQPGCVIGKALENYNSNIEGIIEIVIGRL